MDHRRIEPGPNQESVWDYPRPPRIEDSVDRVRVVVDGITIADSVRSKRVLETSHPPVYYIPPTDILQQYLTPSPHGSFCEWKGHAYYLSIMVATTIENGAWYYPNPAPRFAGLKDHTAFYPGKVEACFVGDEQVCAQQGDFYGGWITSKVVGPFKGSPGTAGW
jgi:uncharacterized protein (DUF427 family)